MTQYGAQHYGVSGFGGDPTPYMLLEIDTELTNTARHYLARGRTDGTAFRAIEFTIGIGGTDVFDYKVAAPVNPDANQLEDQKTLTYPTKVTDAKHISFYEKPKESSSCVYCLLEKTEGNFYLSEIGIWAEIVYSPLTSELAPSNNTFLAAIGHFPLIAKNVDMAIALRVNVNF